MDLNKIESLIEAIVSDLKNNLLKPMAKELEDHIEHLKVHIVHKYGQVMQVVSHSQIAQRKAVLPVSA